MPKKTAKTEPKAKPEEAAATPTAPLSHDDAVGLPRFNFNARPTTTEESMTSEARTPIRPTYESVQSEARGPGVEEWKRTDKLRAELSATYQSLKDDARYSEEHKAETAWAKYEETRSQVERLAPEARKKMLKSAEGLERMSIPTPEGEGLITKDHDKLLLTAHERDRIEGLINRAEKVAKGSGFKRSPADILKAEYERGLDQGGPSGGATVRAVYELARDWGVDIHTVVDAHRKPHHNGALEDAQAARIRSEMIGRTVPEPPFKKSGPGVSLRGGSYPTNARMTFVPKEKRTIFKRSKPYWS